MKRLRDENGAVIILRTVDVGSAALAEDVTEVLAKDVAKARRENRKRLARMPWFIGTADRAWVYDNSGATPDPRAWKEMAF
jgi:predicted ABC-type ATPase